VIVAQRLEKKIKEQIFVNVNLNFMKLLLKINVKVVFHVQLVKEKIHVRLVYKVLIWC
jgi:hypothetical protein